MPGCVNYSGALLNGRIYSLSSWELRIIVSEVIDDLVEPSMPNKF